MSHDLITLAGDVIRETDQAWLVEFHDGEQAWLPKSIGHHSADGRISAPQWKIDQEGWLTQ